MSELDLNKKYTRILLETPFDSELEFIIAQIKIAESKGIMNDDYDFLLLKLTLCNLYREEWIKEYDKL